MFVIALACIVGPLFIIGACMLAMAREAVPEASPTDNPLTEGNDLSLEDGWPIHPWQGDS